MVQSRRSFPLVTLADGRVLAPSGVPVLGGYSGASELYVPSTGTWTTTGPMGVGRIGHSAVSLPDGRVLVSGGSNMAPTIPDELYDPSTGTWSLGASDYTRYLGAAIRLLDGKVLEVGGADSVAATTQASARLFDPTTNSVTLTGSMQTARDAFGWVVLPNGKVLVVGGQDSTGYATATAELYDPASGTWSAAAPAPHAGSTGTLTLIPSGSVLWNSGASPVVDRYDPATNSWSTFGTLPEARSQARATIIGNGLYLIGGYTTNVTNTAVRVDLATAAVTAADPLLTPRMGFAMATLPNGDRLIASGQTSELYHTCEPTTCAVQGLDCGSIPDGCGGTLSCGACNPGFLCTKNACTACVANTCTTAGATCGTLPDGCGGTLSCGTCDPGFLCTQNVCTACVPRTCATVGATCGTLADGCGGTLSCGTCPDGQGCEANTCKAPVVSAVYDAARKVPACAQVGRTCDSMALLVGRGSLGPEPNAPNTINGSCADSSVGRYHSDESLDRLKVSSLDGGALTEGKAVRIEATVWTYAASVDRLDLYSASNTTTPSWTLIATLAPTASGASVLVTTTVLPTGAVQAIRGHFRYGGTASPCQASAYSDHDDLVFAVADGQPPTVLLTNPASGALLRGVVPLAVSASDNRQVTRVDYFAGAAHVASATQPPFSANWDTASAVNGPIVLVAQAFDLAGNSATSAPVTVTVDNALPQSP